MKHSRDRKSVHSPYLMMMVIPILLIIGIFVVLLTGNMHSQEKALERAQGLLLDSAQEQVVTLETLISGQYAMLQAMAQLLSLEEDLSWDNLQAKASSVTSLGAANFVAFADQDGNSQSMEGQPYNVSQQPFFQASSQGELGFTLVPNSTMPEQLLVLSVPVTVAGEIKGVLYSLYAEQTLSQLLVPQAYDQAAFSFVCDKNGQILIGSQQGGVFQVANTLIEPLKEATYHNQYSFEKLQQAEGGTATLQIDGVNYFAVFDPLDSHLELSSELLIVNVLPEVLLLEEVRRLMQVNLLNIVVVMAFAFMTVAFIIYRERQNSSRLKLEADKLRLREQEYRIVAEHGGKMVLRYDLRTKTSYQISATATEFGIPETLENVPQSLVELGVVAKESVAAFNEYFAQMLNGQPSGSAVYCLRRANNNYAWYHSDFTTIFDDQQQPQRAIISFYDITQLREKEVAYEKWRQSVATRDPNSFLLTEYNLSLDNGRADHEEGSLYQLSQFTKQRAALNVIAKRMAGHYVYAEDRSAFLALCNRENLLDAYQEGKYEHQLEMRVTPDMDQISWVRLTIELVQYPNSQDIKAYILFDDIDMQTKKRLAAHASSALDSLTQALNRKAFIERAGETLQRSSYQAQHAFLMMDLDGFKMVNDTFGHQVGDQVLIDVVKNVRALLRSNDLLCRIGGDEFIVCLENVRDKAVIEKKARQICEALHMTMSDSVQLSGSIGISLYPQDGTNFETLYHKADLALYHVKQQNKDGYAFYRADMHMEEANLAFLVRDPIESATEACEPSEPGEANKPSEPGE